MVTRRLPPHSTTTSKLVIRSSKMRDLKVMNLGTFRYRLTTIDIEVLGLKSIFHDIAGTL